MAYAYCFRTGEIGLCESAEQLPRHAIVFDRSNDLNELRARTKGRAGNDERTGQIFVPGVYLETNHAIARAALAQWFECNELSNRWFYADDLKQENALERGVA